MRTTGSNEAITLGRRQILEQISAKDGYQLPGLGYRHLTKRRHRSKDERQERISPAQDIELERPPEFERSPEETLAKARSELMHMARITSLGTLTASIAHEVNQPLAAIITNGQTGLRLLAREAPDVAKFQELTTRMIADARRAFEIIDRIRAMATRRPSEPTQLSLHEIINESITFLHHELQSRSISVSLELAPKLPDIVGDRIQLQQVIVNLAINAIQAMAQPTGRSILVRTMRLDPETVCCSVEDSGPGVDPTHLPRLFDDFFTTKDCSMGIGLAISRTIVEALGGHITADNNSSIGGARFSFALPCVSPPIC
jgi:C4-dicarboxylate-specific signal transduction histidine kinase